MEYQAYMDLAEYVAGGRPLTISKELISLVKRYGAFRKYQQLYRIWPFVDTDKVLQQVQQGKSFKVKETHACSRSLEAIKLMYEEEGYERYKVLVTKYTNVVGFDPIEVLLGGLSVLSDRGDFSFVRQAIMRYEFQQEVCVVEPITEIHKEDIFKVLTQ
jgi:hypothetical protein